MNVDVNIFDFGVLDMEDSGMEFNTAENLNLIELDHSDTNNSAEIDINKETIKIITRIAVPSFAITNEKQGFPFCVFRNSTTFVGGGKYVLDKSCMPDLLIAHLGRIALVVSLQTRKHNTEKNGFSIPIPSYAKTILLTESLRNA